MPLYQYQCSKCKYIEEHISKYICIMSYCQCKRCGQVSKKIMSTPHFRVTGANAKNGYSSIPTYDEVVDENGYAKKKWGGK